ncbi:MAG: T9SS type A sorting domain-containing protein [Bacteroidetes bacterium]|nr:T9SS type A sorting domain-containing protein [Bacteroidota bacterium]
MKKIYTSLFMCFVMLSATAQRYMTPQFSSVDVQTSVAYGVNATVLYYSVLNEAVPEALVMDVYTPSGDTETNRPVILYFHTGNFLPFPQNQGTGGTRTDSTAVEICTRLAKLGYVVASCDYRLGWNPIAPTQEERVNTLINAAYRGVQDCRTAVRYFRKSVAESNNPFGIDPSRIAVWGQGTGGYITLAASGIDNYTDILLPKFTTSSGIPMVLDFVNGDIYGTSVGVNPTNGDTLCYANHVGYSSDFTVAVNMGGACGDISWIDATDNPIISFQVPTDPFAPYYTGTVIVPGLNLPVVEVSGSYEVQYALSQYGNNGVFQLAEGYIPGQPFTDAANLSNNGFFGLFPFNRPATQPADSGPWEWWDAATNPGSTNGLLTNPDMSAAKGKAFCDSIIGYSVPRIACAFNLQDSPCYIGVSEEEEMSFGVFPNPATTSFAVRANGRIAAIRVSNNLGQVVYNTNTNNQEVAFVNTSTWSSGLYFVELISTEGNSAIQKLIIE